MTFSALEKTAEETTVRDVSENAIEDVVELSRGSVIANEEAVILSTLQYMSGWSYSMDRYVNSILIGPSAGGKTMVQDCASSIIPTELAYATTDASNNAMLDDPEWDQSVIAIMDEVDKLSKPIVEYMKSMAGEDGGFTKKRDVEDSDAESGFSPVTISSDAMPFQTLYAPEGKKTGIPHELDTRLMKLHVDDNKHIRTAIGRKEAGHENIEVRGLDNEYIYPTAQVENALRGHVRDLPVSENFDDEGELESRRGGCYTEMPRWVWYAIEGAFDKNKTFTNRVYGMVFGMIRGSAIINHHARESVSKPTEDGTKEALLVHPQDVVNVMSCQRTLLGTTHQLDPRKRNYLRAVDNSSMLGDGSASIDSIKSWLEDNDIPHPNKQTLREHLQELADDYFIRIREHAGEDGAHLYQWMRNGSFGFPRLDNLSQYADADDVELGEYSDVYGVDPDVPFEGTTDPIRDQPFAETVDELRAELTADEYDQDEEEMDTSAAAFMSGDESDDGGETQATLGGSTATSSIPEPEGEIESVVEQAVYDRVSDHCGDGTPFTAAQGVEHWIGAADDSESVSEADLTETLCDSDHEIWDHPSFDDDYVVSEKDARRELDEAAEALREKHVLVVDENSEKAPDGFEVVRTQEPQ